MTTMTGTETISAAEFNAMQQAKGRNKYGAKRTVVDGIAFASKAEARRYEELKLMQQAGDISGLELQPVYQIVVNGVRICRYTGDFRYVTADGRTVIEDVKGSPSRDYGLRKKLMKAVHGIEIQEVRR